MAHSFREIIDFAKNIPEFKSLQLHDQIALIKGSCIEMLFIKVLFQTHYFTTETNSNFLYRRITHFVSMMKHSNLEI